MPLPLAPPFDSQRSYSQAGQAQVETVRETYFDQAGSLVEKQEQVSDDPYQRRLNLINRTTRLLYFVLSLIEVLLALRFLFRLINADATTGFANFIYNFTSPLVGPFNGIFNDQALNRAGVLEISTLVAMAIYCLVGYGIARLVYVLFVPNRNSEEVYTKTRRRRR
jgi:uncharacterized protein YggT (Ycf19 family)